MRPESDSTEKADILQEESAGHFGGAVEDQPTWEIVEAGTKRTLEKELFEPVLYLVTKLVKKEMEEMGRQVERMRFNG